MTSPVILDTHGAVEPSESRNLTEIVVNASKEKKELVRFHTRLQEERRRQNRFAKSGLRNWQRATGATTTIKKNG